MRSAVLLLFSALAGCANLSGLDGSSEFACKAPDGVVCTSVSGVYANSVAGALPAQKDPEKAKATPRKGLLSSTPEAAGKGASEPRPYGATHPTTAAPVPGSPLLSPPKVLRLWLAPWVDEDDDLHDQSYVYVMWHRGEWQIEHTRRQIQRQFAPVAAPAGYGSPGPTARKDDVRQDARDTVMETVRQGQPRVGADDR